MGRRRQTAAVPTNCDVRRQRPAAVLVELINGIISKVIGAAAGS